jgi:hypothetical protein
MNEFVIAIGAEIRVPELAAGRIAISVAWAVSSEKILRSR